MKYFYYEYIQNTGTHRGDTYKCATLTQDNLYSTCPRSVLPLHYVTEQENGFATLADALDNLYKKIQFNPICVDGMSWLLNTNAISDETLVNYVQTGKGQYEEFNEDVALVLDALGGTAMGYIGLGTNNAGSNKRGTNSMFGSYNPGQGCNVSCNAIQLDTILGHDIDINHRFLIFPEKLLQVEGSGKKATLDFTKLTLDHDNNYWLAWVDMHIYQATNNKLWYYTIDLFRQSANMENALNRLQGKEVEFTEPDNPYQKPDDDTGGHTEDPDDDPIDFPPLPDIDISATGAVNIYRMTSAGLEHLFSSIRSIDPGTQILNWWKNPIEGILGIYAVGYPIKMAASAEQCKMLGWNLQDVIGSRVPQFQYLNVGSAYVNRSQHNDGFLSYSPYCKVSIHLPFIGIRELDTDEVMNHTVTVKYMCDNACGNVIAFIKIGNSVKYAFSGNAAAQVPLCQENWGQLLIAGVTAAAGAGLGALQAAAPAIAGASSGIDAAGGILSGAIQGAGGVGGIASLAKPTVQRSGSLSGSAGLMGVKDCYLIFEDSVPLNPDYFTSVEGRPCGDGALLGNLSGYNIIESCHLTGIPATGPELDEIESLLKMGVIF